MCRPDTYTWSNLPNGAQMTRPLRFRPSTGLLAAGLLLTGVFAQGQEVSGPWSNTFYLQQSWPKQTETNRQIKEDINGTFGTNFKTWDDVANLNIGLLTLRTVTPAWKVGFEIDYSRGRIHGSTPVPDSPLGVGPGTVSFEQKYSIYADLLAMVQYRPFGERGRFVPFLSGGVGMAYEKDTTTLGFSSSLGAGDFELLRVNNSGWFPMLTLGIGMDAYLTERRTWFLEVGLSYSWARMKHNVSASGLLPQSTGMTTVTADTDSTGPNVLFGIGRRF
jgi:hypothetical protein